MPWHVEKRGGRFAVVKGHKGERGGAVVGTHDSRAKALAQLRALYANSPHEATGRRGR